MKTDDTFIPSVYPLLVKLYRCLQRKGTMVIPYCYNPNTGIVSNVESLTLVAHAQGDTVKISFRQHSFLPFNKRTLTFSEYYPLNKAHFLEGLKDFGLDLKILSYLIGDN